MNAYHQLFKYSKHIQKNEINHVHTHSKHLQLFLFMQSFVWQIHKLLFKSKLTFQLYSTYFTDSIVPRAVTEYGQHKIVISVTAVMH